MEEVMAEWGKELWEGARVSGAPTYPVGAYLDLFEEADFASPCAPIAMKYYFYDPTKHGYAKDETYPVLIFLHGASNSFVGKLCIDYAGAEMFASPKYQADFGGAYILVPIANEYKNEDGETKGGWDETYVSSVYSLIENFVQNADRHVGNKFLLGNSSGASMTFTMAKAYPDYFNALIPVSTSRIPEEDVLCKLDENNVAIFYAMAKRDEFNVFDEDILPSLPRLAAMKKSFIFTPEWVYNGDGSVISIFAGVEMGQHCLMNEVQANLMFDDGTPMDERLPRGLTGWIDEVNRGGFGKGRDYIPHGGCLRTGHVEVEDGISLYYEEYGSGDRIILSSQVGFYHRSMHQKMADLGYHVFGITMRGFHPSTLVNEDFGENWYDIFAQDVLSFAAKKNIKKFTYMGASHGAGIGWHLMLMGSDKVEAFIAVVAGPHSLKEGTMSYRQMIEQGIIKEVPPFDPPIDDDMLRQKRRDIRNEWMTGLPKSFLAERKLDYKRPLMRLKTEEKLCEALRTITVPTLLIGGYDDPIATPELLMRTAGCLRHCKLVIYSNCGHNIDTDLIEETAFEADSFLKNVYRTGKCYMPAVEE